MIVKGVRAYFYVCQKMTSRSLSGRSVSLSCSVSFNFVHKTVKEYFLILPYQLWAHTSSPTAEREESLQSIASFYYIVCFPSHVSLFTHVVLWNEKSEVENAEKGLKIVLCERLLSWEQERKRRAKMKKRRSKQRKRKGGEIRTSDISKWFFLTNT